MQASSRGTDPPLPCGPIQSESCLLRALLGLTKSQSTSVCLKAHESLLLLCGLQAGFSGELLSTHTQLGELLAVRLQDLYSLLPMEDAAELQSWPHTPWSSQFSHLSTDPSSQSVGHMINFFCWLDFLDHLMRQAPQVILP